MAMAVFYIHAEYKSASSESLMSKSLFSRKFYMISSLQCRKSFKDSSGVLFFLEVVCKQRESTERNFYFTSFFLLKLVFFSCVTNIRLSGGPMETTFLYFTKKFVALGILVFIPLVLYMIYFIVCVTLLYLNSVSSCVTILFYL